MCVCVHICVTFLDVFFSTDEIRGIEKEMKREKEKKRSLSCLRTYPRRRVGKGCGKGGKRAKGGRKEEEEQRAKSGNARKRRRRGSGPRPD